MSEVVRVMCVRSYLLVIGLTKNDPFFNPKSLDVVKVFRDTAHCSPLRIYFGFLEDPGLSLLDDPLWGPSRQRALFEDQAGCD